VTGQSGSRPAGHLEYRVDFDLGRVRGFSDCVFAVAITIVVVTFALPNRVASDDQLARDLVNEWPRYLSYLAAFAVIGYTWVTHHQLFEVIRRVDTATVWINLALLSFIVLTPYPMQLLGRFREMKLPYVLFNLDALLFGVLNLVLVVYATRGNRLVSDHLPPLMGHVLRLRAAVFPLALALATLLAVPFGAWSTLMWIGVPLGRWILRRKYGSLGELVDAGDEDALGDDATVMRAERIGAELRRSGRSVPLGTVFAQSGSLTRLLGFSDNVYAFAITLLVLALTVPSPPLHEEQLREAVMAQVHPDLVGFFVGFAVVGLFWTIHHRYFLVIERQDAWLRALNLVHLMFIAVMPFATLVLSAYDRYRSSTILYAVCAGLASSSLVLLLFYATQDHRLVDPAIPWRELRERRRLALIAPGGFVISIPVALASPALAQLLWLIPFVGIRAFRFRRGQQELHERATDPRGS
jgi:uncharacterized membrane protein